MEEFLRSIPLLGTLIAEHPLHLFFEVSLIFFTVYLLVQKSYKPAPEKLSRREQDELIDEWTPEPLVTALSPLESFELEHVQVVTSPATRTVVIDGRECLNLASNNYLGLAAHPSVMEAANKAIEKYGCGSCGPRGFYGTLDIHLELEQRLCSFLGAEGACVYSSAYATATSVIPAFSQQQDFIVCDSLAHHAIKGGVTLSRSTALWFAHNSMEDLERCLKTVVDGDRLKKRRLTRRWIVVEGVYSDSGQIVDLPRVIQLARQYCFRVMLDDSNGLGVLGATGRGVWEHYGLPSTEVDILFADMSRAIASTAGFCAGRREIADHQRLNGSGYCFSASLPPYLCASAIASLNIIHDDSARLQRLRDNIRLAHDLVQKQLSPFFNIPSSPLAPFVHLTLKKPAATRLDDEKLLQQIVDACFQQKIAITRSKNSRKLWNREHILPPPSLRLTFSSEHTPVDIEQSVQAIVTIAQTLF